MYFKAGSAGLRAHINSPVMPLHDDAMRDTEAQARSLAGRLGGEKGIENVRADGVRHARAGIFHLDSDPLIIVAGSQRDVAFAVHRIDGVVYEVRPDLIELAAVSVNAGQVWGILAMD